MIINDCVLIAPPAAHHSAIDAAGQVRTRTEI
jgi:hypothetical protein